MERHAILDCVPSQTRSHVMPAGQSCSDGSHSRTCPPSGGPPAPALHAASSNAFRSTIDLVVINGRSLSILDDVLGRIERLAIHAVLLADGRDDLVGLHRQP